MAYYQNSWDQDGSSVLGRGFLPEYILQPQYAVLFFGSLDVPRWEIFPPDTEFPKVPNRNYASKATALALIEKLNAMPPFRKYPLTVSLQIVSQGIPAVMGTAPPAWEVLCARTGARASAGHMASLISKGPWEETDQLATLLRDFGIPANWQTDSQPAEPAPTMPPNPQQPSLAAQVAELAKKVDAILAALKPPAA